MYATQSILIAVSLALAANAEVKEPFFFIHGSDPQIGWCESGQQLGQGFAQDTANLEFVVATANRLRPAFMIFTGDLVNRPGDAGQIAEYFRLIDKLDRSIPLYHVAGNHDVQNRPTPASLSAYRNRFGPDYYTFRVGGMAAFVVNSQVVVSPEHVPDELAKQEAWLRRELATAKQDGMRELVVFQHHLMFAASPDEKDTYYALPLRCRRKYLDLYSEFGVSHVFSGHYHRSAASSYGPMKLTTATAISCADTQSGIRIVTVKSTGTESRAYDFGVLPTRIDLRP